MMNIREGLDRDDIFDFSSWTYTAVSRRRSVHNHDELECQCFVPNLQHCFTDDRFEYEYDYI